MPFLFEHDYILGLLDIICDVVVVKRPDLGDSSDDASQSFQARCASLEKKCKFRGQREKLRTPT
ncbi:unnamed protein product [Clonostachys rosea]|uniref:Uncharacterized protein n=1 Tax=Bionectria ochroleuca TaxID=29856 RepID=A0ABY6UV26_BIOOC|nr:unnamed protein product [Clonostachys rosea]